MRRYQPLAGVANAALSSHVMGVSVWLRSIGDDRVAFVDKPALLLWGLKGDVRVRCETLW